MMCFASLMPKSHEHTGNLRCQCVVSNFEYDGHIPRHIYQNPWRNGSMVGCPWRGQFITPKRRSGRAPQGSPSYTGGRRLEVPLFPCCTPPGCAIVIRAYRLQIARIGITDGHGGKQKNSIGTVMYLSMLSMFYYQGSPG